MLSNTDDKKPRPNAVCHDAAGSSSTGIIDAHVTKASRKSVPLKVSGMMSQSGLRSGAATRMTIQTAMPSTGKTSSTTGNRRLAVTLAATATTRIATTIHTRVHSMRTPEDMFRMIGEYRCCDDGGEVADMDLPAKHVARHRASDQRRRNIVEEARQDEHDCEQREAPLPVIRKNGRHRVWHTASLEVTREKRKAHQQQEKIGENDPLVLHVDGEPANAGTKFESGKGDFVARDRRQARERDLKRVTVKKSDPEQRHPKQDEIDRDAQQVDWGAGLGGSRDGRACCTKPEQDANDGKDQFVQG